MTRLQRDPAYASPVATWLPRHVEGLPVETDGPASARGGSRRSTGSADATRERPSRLRTAPVPDGVEDILWPPATEAEPVPTGDPEARFVQIIFAVRLGTTALSMALAASQINQGHLSIIVWSSIVLTYNGFRLWQPLRD